MDVYIWKLLLKNLVLPPTGPLILGFLGLALTAGARFRRVGLLCVLLGVTVEWVVATPRVADVLLHAAEDYPALDLTKPIAARAIVILAGGIRLDAPEYGRSVPNATTLTRLVYGAHVARATGLPVLVSGSRHEAAAMRDFLESELSMTPQWVENRSRDTHENATMSAAILEPEGIHRIVLVTSSAHMRRALEEFRAAGITSVPAPAEMWTPRDTGVLEWVPNPDALMRSQRALYELLGLVVQKMRFALVAHGLLHEPGALVPARTPPSPSPHQAASLLGG